MDICFEIAVFHGVKLLLKSLFAPPSGAAPAFWLFYGVCRAVNTGLLAGRFSGLSPHQGKNSVVSITSWRLLRAALADIPLLQGHPPALIGGEVGALPPLQAAAPLLRRTGEKHPQIIAGRQQRVLGVASLHHSEGPGRKRCPSLSVPLRQSYGRRRICAPAPAGTSTSCRKRARSIFPAGICSQFSARRSGGEIIVVHVDHVAGKEPPHQVSQAALCRCRSGRQWPRRLVCRSRASRAAASSAGKYPPYAVRRTR